MLINILAIFVESDLKERVSLLAINIFLHFQIIHQISWMLPHGDTIPSTCKRVYFSKFRILLKIYSLVVFFRNSLILTIFVLLESLLTISISTTERQPPTWIKSFFLFIQNKQLGFIFLQTQDDKEDQDESVLIQGEKITHSRNNRVWRNLCFFVDKLSIFVITILYVILSLTLIPFRYGAITDQIKVIS